MKNVTISDIAKAAGVSKTTVSRVLNHSGPVDIDTEKRVIAVIKQNNYVPSTVARNLSRGESTTIAVLVPDIANPFFAEIVQEISEEVMRRGLSMICFNNRNEDNRDEDSLNIIKYYRVKGLLYTPANIYSSKEDLRRIRQLLKEINAPIVMMDRKIDGLQKVEGVYFDDYQAAYNATSYLIERGHTRIALISAQRSGSLLMQDRTDGYLAALKDCGVPVREEYMHCYSPEPDEACAATRACLEMEQAPTAFITGNNYTSLGFLKAVHDLGLSMPRDIEHIGFDRIKMLDFVCGERNHMERNTTLLGRRAIEMLLDRILMPNKPYEDTVIQPELILRDA